MKVLCSAHSYHQKAKKQGPHDNSLVWGHDNDLALLLTNDDAVVGSIIALSDGAKPFLPGSIPDL